MLKIIERGQSYTVKADVPDYVVAPMSCPRYCLL